MRKLTIEGMQEIAKSRGGSCTSSEYVDSFTKLRWRCNYGHEWKAIPHNIRRGSWCPICSSIGSASSKRKYTIQDIQNIAKTKGGICLSSQYISFHKKLEWECKEGHIWTASFAKVKFGRWCPYCAHCAKLTIKEMNDLANSKMGKCLSNIYTNNRTKLKWRCNEEHEWYATPRDIKTGRWCKICSYKKRAENQRHNIEDMKRLAESKGGNCLSKNYISAHTKLKWRCNEGHIWETTPASISSGHWCYLCTSGRGERVCRKLFEKIFDEKFHKKKPRWLVGSTGNLLELDGYCKKLNLAFEYQGRQHYQFVQRYYKTKEKFLQRLQDDKLKKKLCRKRGIILIEVPHTQFEKFLYIGNKEELNRIVIWLLNKLTTDGVKVFKTNLGISDEILRTLHFPDKLIEIKELAKLKQGECLSDRYISDDKKLTFKCWMNHIWESRPNTIKKGCWCPICAKKISADKRRKYTIWDMQKLANIKNGKCLSKGYTSFHKKLEWECKEGHVWEAPASSIKSGKWCLKCYQEKIKNK